MATQVADVIIVRNGRVLLVQQRKETAYGLWGFPGGHIELGETPEAAIHREVSEELGIRLEDAKLYKTYPYISKGKELQFHTFTGNIKSNVTLNNDELLSYGWFSLAELEAIVDKLHTPLVFELSRPFVHI